MPANEQTEPYPGKEPAAFGDRLPDEIHVLCISEEPGAAQSDIVPPLQRAGMQVQVVRLDRRTAPDFDKAAYDLVLLDMNAPTTDGFRMLEAVRNVSSLPVLLVLRGAARTDVLRGFQLGADAYVLAPFDPRELLARLNALLRRSHTGSAPV